MRGRQQPRLAPGRPETDTARRTLLIHERLCAEYGCPRPYFADRDPLSELVSALLSHRTRNAMSARAYARLREAFPTWDAVRDAPAEEVEALIADATWPELKGPRIQTVLRELTRRLGSVQLTFGGGPPAPPGLGLEFLAYMPVPEARAWLESIPGVGPKTSAAVLSFSTLRGRALPVDSHHHRVAVRLGLVPARTPVGPAHAALEGALPAEWDAQGVYDHHQVMMIHGKKCCFPKLPACVRCPVLSLCPFGRERLGLPPPEGERTGPVLEPSLFGTLLDGP